MRGLRTFACVSLVCGLTSTARAQQFDWAELISGQTGVDQVQPASVSVDTGGNLYIVGILGGTADFDPGPGFYPLASGQGASFAVKLSGDGTLFWAGRLGGNSNVVGTAGAVDAGGNLLSVGMFEGTLDLDPGPAIFNVTAVGANDVFIAKLGSAAGNLLWGKRLGGSSFDEAHGVTVDGSGNVITVGQFSGTSDFDPGPGTFNLTSSPFTYDCFVSKLDSAGNFIWARHLGGPGMAYTTGLGVASDSIGNVYVAGTFSATVDFDPGPGTFNLAAAGGTDIYVVKLDSSGDFLWAKRLGGALEDGVHGVAVDSGGNVYTVGAFNGTADFDPGPGAFNLTAAGADAFVSKLDGSGSFVWARQLGGASSLDEVAQSVAVDAVGVVHVVGWFNGTADFDPGAGTSPLTAAAGDDAFAVGLSSAGGFVWAARLGGSCLSHSCQCCTPGNDHAYGVGVSEAGHTYTVGSFRGIADFDPGNDDYVLSSAGLGDDMFLSKLAPNPVAGRVPETAVDGVPLTVQRVSDTRLILAWGVSCRSTDENYEIYEGVLGDFTSHVPRYCLGGSGTTRLATVSPGNRYYLVVPSNQTSEGSYGRDSAGNERPASASACRLQSIDRCLP